MAASDSQVAALYALELSEFQWQRRDRALTHEALVVALRAFCERIAERAAGQTRLLDGHLPMPLRAGRNSSPYMFDESGYRSPVAAALAPPASLDVPSPFWRRHMGRLVLLGAVGNEAVCRRGSGGAPIVVHLVGLLCCPDGDRRRK